MRAFCCCLGLVAVAAFPSSGSAQNDSLPNPVAVGPPIQRIATASALSTEPLGSILSVRELPDGRVLVNDGMRRRLLLMDTTLQAVEVVLDSLSEIANTYGTRPGALLPYHADSTLFVDPASFAMVVIDPAGRVVRVRSVWRVEDVGPVTAGGRFGWPGLDGRGRMVYRVAARPAMPSVMPPQGVPWLPPQPDSAFIVAVDLDTRRLDTLGAIRIPKTEMNLRRRLEGGFAIDQVYNPLPVTDEWAVLADGRVAFVRAIDYRIDYLHPDGSWSSSAKLPYDWQRLTDEDKQSVVDSMRVVQERNATNTYVMLMIRWSNMFSRPYPQGFTVADGWTPMPGIPRDWILPPGVTLPPDYVYACAPGETPAPPAARAPPAAAGARATPGPPARPSCMPAPVMMSGGTAPPPPQQRHVIVMPPKDLPDYRPPLATGAVRADEDGHLWIRTNPPRPVPGGPVYDIIDPAGELVQRLQPPPGYTLVGFGRGRVVYLSMRDASGIHLARVRLR